MPRWLLENEVMLFQACLPEGKGCWLGSSSVQLAAAQEFCCLPRLRLTQSSLGAVDLRSAWLEGNIWGKQPSGCLHTGVWGCFCLPQLAAQECCWRLICCSMHC